MTADPGGEPPAAVLAVDGGNSKTDAALLDAGGHLLGRSRGPGSNHQLLGLDGALDALAETVRAAAADAGLDPGAGPLAAVGSFCLAGLDLPVDDERLGPAVAGRRWAGEVRLANDTLAVCRAGLRGTWGVGVVCGAGVNCAGIGPDGTVVRFPSLGELSGDFTPGGAWLGVRALGLALRAGDGRGPDTALAAAVPTHFAMARADDVLLAVYAGDLPYHRLFELAEVLLDAAADGDAPAAGAADQLADEVVAMTTAAIRRLDAADRPVEVVLGGGIFATRHAGFTERVSAGIAACAPRAVLRRLEGPPLLGAALLGLDALGAEGAAADRARAALGAG